MTEPRVPPTSPQGSDRRRAERVRPGALRVRLHRLAVGTVYDISEVGALVWLPTAQTPDTTITLQIDWKGRAVILRGRVVRSTPHQVASQDPVLRRAEYHVAVEFPDLSPEALTAIREMVREYRFDGEAEKSEG